jgi:hypothetical protein
MPRTNKLNSNRAELVLDLQHSGLSFKRLGKKYGVTRQGIHCFYVRNKEEIGERYKPKPQPKPAPPTHGVTQCDICQRITEIGQEQWSYLTWSLGMVGKNVGLSGDDLSSHLTTLRKAGVIHPKFGRVLSDRVAQAYRVYLSQAIPIRRIGEMFGLKNFRSVIATHRIRGFVVPSGLFKWDSETRRKTMIALNEKKVMERMARVQQPQTPAKTRRKAK